MTKLLVSLLVAVSSVSLAASADELKSCWDDVPYRQAGWQATAAFNNALPMSLWDKVGIVSVGTDDCSRTWAQDLLNGRPQGAANTCGINLEFKSEAAMRAFAGATLVWEGIKQDGWTIPVCGTVFKR
jgi:hypothetical protein